MNRHDYLDYLRRLDDLTRVLFEIVPPDRLDWMPAEGMMPIRLLLWHLAQSIGGGVHAVCTGAWQVGPNAPPPPPELEGKAFLRETLAELMRQFALACDDVETLADAVYENGTVTAPPPLNTTQTVRRWLWSIVEHHLNHRMQLFVYLRILGIPVDTALLYRGQWKGKESSLSSADRGTATRKAPGGLG